MANKLTLSSRERVRLALEHRETDRVPIAMVCSGINPPARGLLDAYLRRERNTDLQSYLDALLDVRSVGPAYVGPPLPPQEDMWGVHRTRVHNPAGGWYDEIDVYPLAEVSDPSDLDAHRWPSTDWYEYTILPARISAATWRSARSRRATAPPGAKRAHDTPHSLTPPPPRRATDG